MKKIFELFASYFRNIFGLLFPVLITLGIAYAAIEFYTILNRDEITRKQNLWSEKAQIVLASIRSGHTFSDLISEAGNRLAEEFENNSNFSPEDFLKLLSKHFDHGFIDDQTLIWLFSARGNKILPINYPGLATTHQRVMQRVIQGFLEFSNNPLMSPNEISSKEKFIRGVFGPYSAPLSVGKKREGKLTPVSFEGKKYYLYWRQYRDEKDTKAVATMLFPAERSANIQQVLQIISDRTLETTQKHLAIAFVPIKGLRNQLKTVLPAKIQPGSDYHSKLAATLERVTSEIDDKGKKIYEAAGHLFLRGFLTADLPYDAVIFAPKPIALAFEKPDFFHATAVTVVFWSAVFAFFFWRDGRIGLPLSVSFRVLFFLAGLIPILAMLSAGYSLIEESYHNEIVELKRESSQILNGINERSDNLLHLFGYHISEILKNPRIQNLLNTGSRTDTEKAFAAIRNKMLSMELTLDFLFVAYPGISSEMLVADQRQRATVKTTLSLLGPGVYKMNQILGRVTPLPEIKMDASQKNFYQILSGLPNEFLAATFFVAYEKAGFVNYGNTGKDYYYTAILTKDGKIASYLIFGASSDNVFRRYLARELDLQNSSGANAFLAAEQKTNSDFSIFPFKKMQILQSQAGKKAFSLMKKCRSSIFEKSITDSDHLYLFYPMSKMPRYAGGSIVSLSGPNLKRQTKTLLLFSAAILLSCLMYIISAFATSHLLKPLEKINLVLHSISQGNLDTSLDIDRQDELGQLANAVSLMQNGFKERLRLGKYVSTTLDKSLSEGSSLEDIKKAKEITGTVLFSDIRSFTTLSESFPPSEIAEMLNSHLESMSKEIQAMGGQVEQFIGDAIVAFFPDTEPGDSRSASLRAAMAMHSAHRHLNQRRHEEGRFTYAIGIGLQHGIVITGSLVTPGRYEFSIIGEARHQAEEFEALSKLGSHTRIIVSECFLEILQQEKIAPFRALKDTGAFELMERATEA